MMNKSHLISITLIILSALSISAEVTAPVPAISTKPISPKCPLVSVTCPTKYEPPLTFNAAVIDAETNEEISNANIEYCWTLTKGKIASGQGTNSITVEISPLDMRSLTATVDVRGFDSKCRTQASCSLSSH